MKKHFRTLPNHIGFIMDGNGRWGLKHGGQRVLGHAKGFQVMGEVVKELVSLGVPIISFYAFSVDNWNRSQKEVDYLHSLIKKFYEKDFESYKNEGIRVLVTGFKDRLSQETLDIIKDIEDSTAMHTKSLVNICFNYSGQQEIVEASRGFAKDVLEGRKSLDFLNKNNFHEYLLKKEVPSLDFMIRTSGELRISDFLVYQGAYAEFYFTKILWPNFTKKELYKALKHFSVRKRRFGKEE